MLTPLLRCLTLLLLIQSIGTATADARIAFINPGKHDEFFWPEVTRTMQAAADQFGFTLDVTYAERDAQQMIRLGMQKIAATPPPDFLILVNEFQAAPELLRAAEAKGIKVFMLLNSFADKQAAAMGTPGTRYRNWIGSLVPSNKGAGARMANHLIRCMAESGAEKPYHVLALAGDTTTPASIELTAGMRAAFAAGGITIALDRHFHTNGQKPDGKRLTLNYLAWTKTHKISPAGIWAANDALALGAVEALHETGYEPGRDVCVVGLNWSPEAIDLVAEGKMVATDGGHFLAGGWAMVMINDYLRNDARVPIGNATFGMASIDNTDVSEFLAAFGDRDWRRIPFPRFARGAGFYDFSLTRILALLGQ